MKYNYGLNLLELELEKEQKEKEFEEKSLPESWNHHGYIRFCQDIDRIEYLEKAIRILKNGLNNSNEFV